MDDLTLVIPRVVDNGVNVKGWNGEVLIHQQKLLFTAYIPNYNEAKVMST